MWFHCFHLRRVHQRGCACVAFSYSVGAVPAGRQCNSNTAVNAVLSTTPDATGNTRSASSSGSKSGSQSFISRNVIAALAPTRLVAVDKGVVLAKVKQVGGGHGRDGGVKIFSTKGGLRSRQRGLQALRNHGFRAIRHTGRFAAGASPALHREKGTEAPRGFRGSFTWPASRKPCRTACGPTPAPRRTSFSGREAPRQER